MSSLCLTFSMFLARTDLRSSTRSQPLEVVMNIKATLARLGSSLDGDNISRSLLLLPGRDSTLNSSTDETSSSINLVVGYSDSEKSQAALDLTLLIAYQTRLATRKQVIVQAVYVVDSIHPIHKKGRSHSATYRDRTPSSETISSTATLLQQRRQTVNCVDARAAQIQSFDEADRVLWQARSFAMEWRGSLNTHLRFGNPALELSKVVQQEQASLMIVGCHSVEHPLVQKLEGYCDCPVIGIP